MLLGFWLLKSLFVYTAKYDFGHVIEYHVHGLLFLSRLLGSVITVKVVLLVKVGVTNINLPY